MVISYSPKPWEARIPKTSKPKDRKRSYNVYRLNPVEGTSWNHYEAYGIQWLTGAEVTMKLIQGYLLNEVVIDGKPNNQ